MQISTKKKKEKDPNAVGKIKALPSNMKQNKKQEHSK